MKRSKTATIVLGLILIVLSSVQIIRIHNANQFQSQQSNLYPLQTTVTEINYSTDTVTVIDPSGNLWSFTGIEDWQVNDSCILIMDSNGTEDMTDDIILSETYSGVHQPDLSDMTYIDKSSDNSFTLEDSNGKLSSLFRDETVAILR